MSFIPGLDKETIDRFAQVPHEEMGGMIIELANLRSMELVKLIEEASRQEPPNTAVMVAAGSICVSRLLETKAPMPSTEQVLSKGAEKAFPGFGANSIYQFRQARIFDSMRRT